MAKGAHIVAAVAQVLERVISQSEGWWIRLIDYTLRYPCSDIEPHFDPSAFM